jgi:hypothetical protein
MKLPILSSFNKSNFLLEVIDFLLVAISHWPLPDLITLVTMKPPQLNEPYYLTSQL